MKRLLLLAVVLCMLASVAYAARVQVVPITHEPLKVYQAYAGDSNGTNLSFKGYAGTGTDVISAVPGVLSIVPGTNWSNFVGAAQAGKAYTLKNVVLVKKTPRLNQCFDVFPPMTIWQQGTPSIRLWWPLMFEVPGTTWELTILYGTPMAWDDDGPGPNPPGYVHTEVWSWTVDADLASIANLMALFHQLPFGKCEVPLISDEELYVELQALIAQIAQLASSDPIAAGLLLGEFEMKVMDNFSSACLEMNPAPKGDPPYFGVVNTDCYPAACKLLVDAEYVGNKLGIIQPAK